MFDWIGDAVEWVGEQIGGAVENVGSAISEAVWDVMLKWIYETVFGAISEFFTMINGMGAIFGFKGSVKIRKIMKANGE